MRASRCLLPTLALPLLAPAPALTQDAASPTAGARIHGIVTDSLAHAPLAAATVQLVAADARALPARTTISDSAGRFRFDDVAAGSYVVGFLHPVLDSLGLEPIARTISVVGRREMRVELAVPGPLRLKRAYCGATAEGGVIEGGVIVGFVRTTQGRAPAPGTTVVGTWRELAIGDGAIAGRTVQRVATTGASGGFVLCDVPSPGAVRLAASRGTEDIDRIEVDVPADGVLRRDLYLGEARSPGRDATLPADSLAAAAPRTGPGLLRGAVTAADGARPLADVEVRLAGGEPTRTDARGEWTLAGVPSGTRLLEVRAPGYLPIRRAVDVVGDAPPVEVALVRLAAVLETLRIHAPARSNLAQSGFEHRRRASAGGRFLTAPEIERLLPWATSDLFKYIPGMIATDDSIRMRSAFGDACNPTVVVNGMMMRNLGPGDLDGFVRPQEIAAIEVYLETQVPPQFQDGLSGCGSIVVWTK